MDCKQKFVAEKQDSLSSNGLPGGIEMSASAQKSSRVYSAALEETWRTHSKQILRITRRITNNREDAEDALQDSFLRAHIHLHDFDGRSSIATWLTRIAINSALMILRKRTHAAQFSVGSVAATGSEGLAVDPVDQASSPEAQYAEIEEQAILGSVIGALRPSIRRPLELQALEERPIKEIAGSMGLSVSAAKSRIFRARTALRKSLDPKVNRSAAANKALQLSAA